MENLKRLFVFVIVGLFLINLSSAGLFDPSSEMEFYKEGRNGEYGYYEINDTDFWFFNNKPVKIIELIENKYSVYTAWNIKEIEVFRPARLFDKTNYLDKEQKEDRKNSISSESHFYREWETKTKTINDPSCLNYETLGNQTQACVEWQDNSYEEEYGSWSDWQLYNFQTVQEGIYQTKTIVTRDSQGTGTIEWVDENEGYSLDEWAPWWDSDWGKKKLINLTANVGNFSYLEDITYDADMQADFDDLRFLDFAEVTELNFSISSKNDGVNVTIRVYSQGATALYMYYDNPSVSTTSSSSNTHFIPLGVWNMDETSGNFNDSVGSLDLVEFGTVGRVKGKIGNAVEFDATADEHLNSTSGSINIIGDDDRTVCFWLELDVTNAENYYASWGTSAVPAYRNFMPGSFASDILVTFGSQDVKSGDAPTTNYDFYCFIWEDGDNSLRIIRNDINILDTIPTNPANTLSTPLVVGAGYYTGAYRGEIDGEIDELKIYDKILTPSEMTALFTYTEPNFTVGAEIENIEVSTTLISPSDSSNSTNTFTSFNITSTPINTNLTNVTLYLWNATDNASVLTNFTTLSGNETVNTSFQNNLTQGSYLWNAETCGVGVDCSFDANNNSFVIHTTPAQVNITEPTGLFDFIANNQTLNLSWQITEEGENLSSHIINCSYTYGGNLTYLNISTCVITNTTTFNYIPGINNISLTVMDEFGLTFTDTSNWTVLFEEYNVTFNNQTTEGDQETFTAEIILLTGETISQAIFYYNNTNYTTNIIFSGGEYTVTSTITVPLISVDTNFSLGFYIVISGQTYNLDTFTQLAINVNVSECGVGGNLLLNMSLYDEGTKISIVGDIEVSADAISKTSLEIISSINLSFENVSYGAICLSPSESFSSLYLATEIRYVSDDRVPEFYHIQKADMADYPKNLSLFDLALNDSTEFLIKYQDDNLVLVEDAIVQLQRKYISEDSYEIVEAPLTSNEGTAVVHIDLNTNKYRATIVKEGELLDLFQNIVFDCENELSGQCNQLLLGKIDSQNDVSVISLKDFVATVSSVNNTVTTIFAIPSGTPATVNIVLTQLDQFGNETLCNQTIISSGGSIDCIFLDTIGDSYIDLQISKDGLLQDQRSFIIVGSSGMDFLGNNFLIGLILLLSVVGMAFSSPEWMILNAVMVMVIGGAIWLFNGVDFVMGLGSLMWLIVAAGILIYKIAKQEDR